MRPELELVIALSRQPVALPQVARVESLLACPLDWNAVLTHAAATHLEPAVLTNLSDHFGFAVPEAIRPAIAKQAMHSRAAMAALTLKAGSIAGDFLAAGLDAMVIKGPSVSIAAFDDISYRSFNDLDLLLYPGDLEKGRDLLLAAGFTSRFGPGSEAQIVNRHRALTFSSPAINVDLHVSLFSKHLHLDLPLREVWRDSREILCSRQLIKVPSHPHLFFFLCAHGAKHRWNHVRWLCDIAQYARRLSGDDAEAVADMAARTHGKRILALALQLTRQIFGDEPSPFSDDWFREDSSLGELKGNVITRLAGDDVPPLKLFGWIPSRDPRLGQAAFWTLARERRIDRLASVASLGMMRLRR